MGQWWSHGTRGHRRSRGPGTPSVTTTTRRPRGLVPYMNMECCEYEQNFREPARTCEFRFGLFKKKKLSSSDPHPEPLFWHSFWHTIWKYIWHIFVLTFYLTISDFLSGIYFDILSHILFVFRHSFWHSFWHMFWHSLGHFLACVSGISSDILSGILSGIYIISSEILCGWGPVALAVEVRRGEHCSWACCSGPAENTAI